MAHFFERNLRKLALSVRNEPRGVVITFLTFVTLGFGSISDRNKALILLPGTQVGTVDPADDVQVCKQCHQSANPARPVFVYREWAGSMMAHSAQDPVFFAALAVANRYQNGTGEYCIRCHTPMGWLAGHSEDFTGQAITGNDFNGIQCDYCHRLVDPMNPDSTVPYQVFPVPGYGNGMHVLQKFATPKRGPYDTTAAPHPTMSDPFQRSSNMCAVCHDVSNPYYADNRITQAPYEYAPLERTYSEWLMSAYPAEGDSVSCQGCHMQDTTGYACIYPTAPLRANIAKHDLTGGNTFLPDILPSIRSKADSVELDTAALAEGKQRAIATLHRAADLSVQSYRRGDTVIAKVLITNLTGHKLPTGYPEGRRMWLAIVGQDANGDTVFHSGVYDTASGILAEDPQLKKYEIVQGLRPTTAALYSLPPGASFHFSLNDTVLFDNRIPPKGFDNLKFRIRKAQPVGKAYADNQYWDTTQYLLPSSTRSVTATLYYQSISKDYIEFLRSENDSNFYDWNAWGKKLYASWQTHGKSTPVIMNVKTVSVGDTATSAHLDHGLVSPPNFSLSQNFPNPFNPLTSIRYTISERSRVSLKIFDILGKETATVVHRVLPPGNYTAVFDGSAFPSGLYLYSLFVDGHQQTRKMLLLK